MINRLLFLFAAMLATTQVNAQYADHYERSALAAFYSKDYSAALIYSEKVIEIDTENVTSLFVAGESARMIQDFEKAESYLEQIPDHAKAGYYAVTDFRLAAVKENLDKREEAENYYRKYLSMHDPSTDLLALLAKEALESLKKGESPGRRKGDYLSVSHMGENINSENLEAAPLRYADKIYFTSVYMPEEKKSKPVSRIYESLLDQQPRLVSANPKDGNVNAAHVALMPDASRMYYTLCHDDDYHKQDFCEIWFRDRTYEGEWGPPKRAPEQVNLNGYTATQPSVAWDQTIKKYVLYFVSNRPGGKGALDIWAAAIDRFGNFEEAICLPVNSEKDDVTPFFHQSSQTLFFSSNGWPNFGGFDIFRTNKKPGEGWDIPENLGDLVNSYFDDLHYTFHTNSHKAYFVSNRPSPNCETLQKTIDCLDIFEARVFVELHVRTFSALDKSAVPAPQIELEEVYSDGPSGSFAARNNKNDLSLKVETGKVYRLKITAEGYQPKYLDVDTQGFSYFTSIEKNVYLDVNIDP